MTWNCGRPINHWVAYNYSEHPNLVSLIGTSLEARAIIYEFLPNGNLNTFLTDGAISHHQLSWQNHILIAFEICSALIFLHSIEPHGITHGNLKPENILLDSNFVSKLADSRINGELYQMPHYSDPEFYSSYGLNPKSDTYAFGIILLQLVTGRDPHEIKEFVKNALDTNKLAMIVDDSAGQWPIKEVKKLTKLALQCSDLCRNERPDLTREVLPAIKYMKSVAGLQ